MINNHVRSTGIDATLDPILQSAKAAFEPRRVATHPQTVVPYAARKPSFTNIASGPSIRDRSLNYEFILGTKRMKKSGGLWVLILAMETKF